MSSSSNVIAASAPSSGEAPARHTGVQSLWAAIAGLTSLNAPTSPKMSSPSPDEPSKVGAAVDEGSSESNGSGNRPVRVPSSAEDSAALAASSSSQSGFGDLPAPFAPFTEGPAATDRSALSEQIAAINKASAVGLPPARLVSQHGHEECEAPLPTPASLPKRPAKKRPVPNSRPSHHDSAMNFPQTLMDVMVSDQYPDVINWLPHGRGFVILDKERFADDVLPRHFDGAKYSSFTRRMKRWDFDRVPRGPEMGAYYHDKFVRDRPELVKEMRYGGKKAQEEKKKRKAEKAAENEKADTEKLRRSHSSKVFNADAPLNDDPSSLPLEDKDFKPQEVVPSENAKMDTWYNPANPQGRPMPLPSTLPKHNSPKSASPQKKTKMDATGLQGHLTKAKNATEAATVRNNLEWLAKQRIAERERALLLARSTLSQRVADYVSIPAGVARMPSVANGMLSNPRPHYPAASPGTQRLIELERAKRILEAEIMIEQSNGHRSHVPAFGGNGIPGHATAVGNDGMILPPDMQASSRIIRDAMDVVRDMQSRSRPALVPSLEHYPRGNAGSSGAMAGEHRRQGEEELARYLALKRNA